MYSHSCLSDLAGGFALLARNKAEEWSFLMLHSTQWLSCYHCLQWTGITGGWLAGRWEMMMLPAFAWFGVVARPQASTS
jgi:hypothetical protein